MAEVIEIIEEVSPTDTDKENVVLAENNNKEKTKNEEKEEKTAEILLSPPRKKLKQDALPFPKISKEEALKNLNESVGKEQDQAIDISIEEEKPQCNSQNETEVSNSVSLPSPVTTPSQKKKSISKSPALSKEEREKQRQEKERLKQEKLKELEEKRKQKEDEKRRREEERLQKQAEKEKKELERKAEKEKREQERKEKERLREEDRKKKEEERKKKEEQRENERRAKEAEKEKKEAERKQEEEKKRLKEEAEKKKKEKAANQFRSFFKKKTSVPKKSEANETTEVSRFAHFQVTKNMILAPCVRRKNFDKSILDEYFQKGNQDCCTYLEDLSILIANNKKPAFVTRRQLRKDYEESRKKENEEKPSVESEPKAKKRKSSVNEVTDAVVVEDENRNENSSDEDEDEDETSFIEEKRHMKAIFLKFEENTRPPYYGTWTKKTKRINGRRPFGQDTEIFNYDVDSDEEWIDEPGEDCSDNGEDDEEEEKETEEDQDGFFVPHGYLSDDEGVHNESEDENEDDGDRDESKRVPLSKEAADGLREQEKLKSKVNSFEVVFKKKFKPRKPICIGIKFTNNIEDLDPILKEFAKISLFRPKGESSEVAAGEDVSSKVANDVPENGCSIPQTVPEEAMPFLLKLLHGNQTTISKMTSEFKSYWINYINTNKLTIRSNISKTRLHKTIVSISTKAPNAQIGKICYTVNPEILDKYGMSDLELGTGLIYPIPVLSSVENKDLELSENVTETNAPIGVDAPSPEVTSVSNEGGAMEID